MQVPAYARRKTGVHHTTEQRCLQTNKRDIKDYCFRLEESSRDDDNCDRSHGKATPVNTIAPCRRGREI